MKTYMDVVTVNILGIANIVTFARPFDLINCFTGNCSLNIMLFASLGSFTAS